MLSITLMQQLYAPLNYFGNYYRTIQRQLIDCPELLATNAGLTDISFSYVTEWPVIKNVSFTCPNGQTLTLMGATGGPIRRPGIGGGHQSPGRAFPDCGGSGGRKCTGSEGRHASHSPSTPMLQPKVSSIWEQPGSVHPYAEMPHFETELEITNFIAHRETFSYISELTGVALTIKGNHYEKGQRVPDGERKLYLIIKGPTEAVVKAEIKYILEEYTEKAMRKEVPAVGRYSSLVWLFMAHGRGIAAGLGLPPMAHALQL
ncbi:g4789 [Coccomyxa viridis]|uniref:G4789 protein n=1 Tax=Coccomyxa viridis TaxID=1274662 RepID=A0ABP1FWC7_9CHLO